MDNLDTNTTSDLGQTIIIIIIIIIIWWHARRAQPFPWCAVTKDDPLLAAMQSVVQGWVVWDHSRLFEARTDEVGLLGDANQQGGDQWMDDKLYDATNRYIITYKTLFHLVSCCSNHLPGITSLNARPKYNLLIVSTWQHHSHGSVIEFATTSNHINEANHMVTDHWPTPLNWPVDLAEVDGLWNRWKLWVFIETSGRQAPSSNLLKTTLLHIRHRLPTTYTSNTRSFVPRPVSKATWLVVPECKRLWRWRRSQMEH